MVNMPSNAIQDGNQNFSVIVAGGTAGTADTKGTSTSLAVSGDPSTGAMYVYNLGPAGSVTLGNTPGGTLDLVSSVGGTVKVNVVAGGAGGGVAQTQVRDSTGTAWVDVGYAPGTTLYMPSSVINGTINNSGTTTGVGVVSALTSGSVSVIAGTIGAGTINTMGTLSNLLAGTINSVTTVTNLTHGTIENSGTVTGVGVVTALTSGTVSVNTPGTVTSGSISIISGTVSGKDANGAGTTVNPIFVGGNNNGTVRGFNLDVSGNLGANLVSGTINSVTTVTNLTHGTVENSGTVTGVGVVSALTSGTVSVNTQGTIASGSIAVTAGTVVGTVTTNQNSGTLNVGTINSGTINTGTVRLQPEPAVQVLSANAVGTAAIGTLVSAVGAGTGIYINSIALDVGSGTLDLCLSFGTQQTGAQVVNRGLYTTYGGIAQSFPFPSFYGTSNSPLTYQILGGAGTAYWNVTYTSKGTP